MALLDDDATVELVGGVKAARDAAHELVGGQIARSKERLRSSSKTRKSALTRARIMEAASALMVERGSTSFLMSEVSERCRMSKGSLYYYFADRDELIAAIFEESVTSLVEQIEAVAASASSARGALQGLYGEFARRLRDGSVLALALTYEMAGTKGSTIDEVTASFSRVTKVITAQLERAKTEGVVREDVDSELAATFATGGFLATSMLVASGQVNEDVDVLVARLMDVTFLGVGELGISLS